MMPDCCSPIVCTRLCLTALPTPPFDFAASSHLATAGIDNISGRDQRDSRFSRILENFFSFSLLVLDLEPFQFHFHLS